MKNEWCVVGVGTAIRNTGVAFVQPVVKTPDGRLGTIVDVATETFLEELVPITEAQWQAALKAGTMVQTPPWTAEHAHLVVRASPVFARAMQWARLETPWPWMEVQSNQESVGALGAWLLAYQPIDSIRAFKDRAFMRLKDHIDQAIAVLLHPRASAPRTTFEDLDSALTQVRYLCGPKSPESCRMWAQQLRLYRRWRPHRAAAFAKVAATEFRSGHEGLERMVQNLATTAGPSENEERELHFGFDKDPLAAPFEIDRRSA